MRKTSLLLASIAFAVMLAGGAALAASSEAGNPGNAEARDAVLDASMKALVERRGGPPGAIAVVQRGNDREVHAFGVSNLKRDLPMRADARMRQASTSKAFNGAVALSLVDKGEMSLNDTIGEYLPGLPKSWHEVTLRQLLDHTSGLPNFTEDPGYLRALSASPENAPTPRKLLSYVEDEPLNFEPGSDYRYSNSDNVAVGLMVRVATGDTYEEQLQEQVLGPLGLKETSLPRGVNLKPPYIHGYDNDPSEQPPEDISEVIASGWPWAAGGMVSTPYDFNDFVRGYVGGDLFSKKVRAQQRQVVPGGSSEPPGPGKNSAGLGIFRYETRCGTVWGHTGNYPGYTQFMAASPNGKRSVTVSVNEQLSPVEGAPGVFDALRRAEVRAVCAALATR
ncbi:MAG TPA: serine hydrolase domain-containing protein [Rubrobacter sp.]|nr:serine hydrolase domain-containing protein [Rubrobacter sp.]